MTTARLVDSAARYIAGRLAFGRLLEGTDPEGWQLARRLGRLADHLGAGRDTAAWVEEVLPRLGDGRRSREPAPR